MSQANPGAVRDPEVLKAGSVPICVEKGNGAFFREDVNHQPAYTKLAQVIRERMRPAA